MISATDEIVTRDLLAERYQRSQLQLMNQIRAHRETSAKLKKAEEYKSLARRSLSSRLAECVDPREFFDPAVIEHIAIHTNGRDLVFETVEEISHGLIVAFKLVEYGGGVATYEVTRFVD